MTRWGFGECPIRENGVNGFMFHAGSADQLKEVLEGLLHNPEKLNTVKDKLRTSVNPSIEQEAHAYEREYKKLLKAGVKQC